jgi:uncharacterized Tic20 family protein
MSSSDSPSGVLHGVSADDRTWAMIAHFSALAFFLLPVIGCVIGPLVVWLMKREQSAFASEAAKEAFNFNLTVLLGYAVCALFFFVFIGFLLAAALFAYWLVMTILAGVKASEGFHYRYPVALRILK